MRSGGAALGDGLLRPLRPDDAAAAAALVRSAFAEQGVATDPPSSALRETADSSAPGSRRAAAPASRRRAR